MKKFTFKGVLDGFRSSVANQQTRVDQEIVETLRSDNFQVAKVNFPLKMADPRDAFFYFYYFPLQWDNQETFDTFGFVIDYV